MNVLINGIGISDSGGVTVLEKVIGECLEARELNKFTILLSSSDLIDTVVKRYQKYDFLSFRTFTFKGYTQRLCYENFKFRSLINIYDIDLVYNISGSAQFFLRCPQLLKVHNLLFYSKSLDSCYRKKTRFILWIKQVYLKRVIFKFMLGRSKYIEIQSRHVKTCLLDYINIENKLIFIKSDVDVANAAFSQPKKYDFSKKLKFLYVVGPHFEYIHKNFLDFVSGMIAINKLNVDFEINITLEKGQLTESGIWNELLTPKTNFHGYIDDPEKMRALFSDNTILVSTSVIETLGLHVLEGIKNGVVTITPNEDYAQVVYGKKSYSYELFDSNSLCKTVKSIIKDADIITDTIMDQQKYIRENEETKFNNIVEVFREVLHV